MRLLKFLWWTLVAMACSVAMGFTGTVLYLGPGLPAVDSLRTVRMQVPLRVYSHDRKLIAEFGEMRRSPLPFAAIPPQFIDALLAAEDDNFRNHHGVDIKSLMRAASQLASSGQIQTGGSTITMQVAKNFFLTNERSFTRKINEILLALQIERTLSKDEILELYVNKIYLGNRAYGIEAAAQAYYGKSIRELSLAQLAMIAGLPKAPSAYNPVANPERAKVRRDWILHRMQLLGKIDQAQLDAALAEPVEAITQTITPPDIEAPYVAEMARAEMVGRYGSDAYTEGFRVYTSIRSDLQVAANHALRDGLTEYDHRHGYRGPEKQLPELDQPQWLKALSSERNLGNLEPAIVTAVGDDGIEVLLRDGSINPVGWDSMRWARKYLHVNSQARSPQKPRDVATVGDLIRVQRQEDGSLNFAQLPAAQSALVSLRPQDGAIMALIGGFSFEQSNYNRVTQARRQPGSSFKPFIYSAAIDHGYTPASLIDDSPMEYTDPWTGKVWRPQNDNMTFLGPIRMREALYRSRNIISIRLLSEMGLDYVMDYSQRFSLPKEQLPQGLSMALGTASLTPLEIATGYSVFANGGYKVTPWLIERIESRDGDLLFSANPATAPSMDSVTETGQGEGEDQPAATEPATTGQVAAEQVLDPRTAFIMTSMMQDVIRKGTGVRAKKMGREDIAGKTGTTNEQKDSWFSGFNGDYVTTVWAGFDQPETLGRKEYGGTVALPIWMRYMSFALQDRPMHLPPEPPGLLSVKVSPATGRASNAANAYFELFKSENPPLQASAPNTFSQDSFGGEPTAVPMDLF